jgi:selenocysteine lyase/cysteine desulfurase
VLDWRQKHDLDFLTKGSLIKNNEGEILQGVREKVGKLFNCAPHRVSLRPSFSVGFNTLVSYIPKKQKVLLLEQDYPSVNGPFAAGNFEVRYAQVTARVEDEVEAAFAKAQPNIFAFSLVQWINGIKINQEFLKRLKAKYPKTLFCADATQYLGTEQFDFENSALDVLGASTYKWLNAGYGNAIFMFKDEVLDHLDARGLHFAPLQGEYKPSGGSFLGFFEPGHLDTFNFGSLGAAIDLVNNIEITTIDTTIKNLAQKVSEAFNERGLLENAVRDRELHGTIFNIKGDHELYKRLLDRGVLCVERGTGIRVGFHYFNDQKDLDILLMALDTPE